MDFFLYILAGAGVGFVVGLTGVGGGSLMTPTLMLFGFPLHVAVGTDLLYATITKSGGAVYHHRVQSIDWRTVRLLALGSLPMAFATVLGLYLFFDNPAEYAPILRTCLGIMLILTAISLVGNRLRQQGYTAPRAPVPADYTVALGAALGVLVTLSSVGAAAIATAVLMMVHPQLSGLRVLGTNLAHAIPLTLVGGLGHLFLGNVDLVLLVFLLVGSLPAIYAGSHLARQLPDRVLQSLLVSALLGMGVKFTFF